MPKNNDLTTKAKIQKIALKLFAKNGYKETSTKEICRIAKVNSASITYHFGSKDNLLASIFKDEFSRMPSPDTVFSVPKNEEEFKIKLELIGSFSIDHLYEKPELFILMSRESDLNSSVFKIFKGNVLTHHNQILNFFKASKEAGLIRDDIDISLVAHTLIALVTNPVAKPSIGEVFPELDLYDLEKRKHYLKTALSIFFNGIIRREK